MAKRELPDSPFLEEASVGSVLKARRGSISNKVFLTIHIEEPPWLPDDMVQHVFSFLSPPDLVKCSLVCWRWYRLSGTSVLWERHCKALSRLYVQSHLTTGNDGDWKSRYIEERKFAATFYGTSFVSRKKAEKLKQRLEEPISSLSPSEVVRYPGRRPFPALCVCIQGSTILSGYKDSRIRVYRMGGNEGTKKVDLLSGHSDAVYAIDYDSVNERAVSGGADCMVRFWQVGGDWSEDVHGGSGCDRLVCSLSGPTGPVRCVKLADNLQRVVAGSFDGTVRVWDMKTGKLEHVLSEHGDSVTSVKMEGNWILSGSSDSTVRVWDIRTGKSVGAPHCVSPVRCLDYDGIDMIVGMNNGHCALYDFRMMIMRSIWRQHRDYTCSVRLDNHVISTSFQDGMMQFLDRNSILVQKEWSSLQRHNSSLKLHDVAYGEAKMVTAHSDGSLSLWKRAP